MARCGSCGGRRSSQKVDVTLPGKPTQRVASEAAAARLTKGVKGAVVKPVKEGKS